MKLRIRLLYTAVVAATILQGAFAFAEPVAPPKLGDKPDAKALIAAVRKYYGSVSSFRAESVTDSTVKQDGKVVQQSKDAKFTVLFRRPNKLVLISPASRISSDGRTLYNYYVPAKRYAKVKMSPKVLKDLAQSKAGLGMIGMLTGVDYSSAVSSYKLLDDAKVGGRDVYVVAIGLKPGVACPAGVSAIQTLYIGKDDFGIYRNDILIRMNPKAPKGYKGKVPKLIEDSITRRATRFVVNASIPDSEFKAKLPAGAKPMEKPKAPISVVKKKAPDFSFRLMDGSPQKKLSDFRGKMVVLEVWALPMCEKHLPVMQGLYTHQKGVQLITINVNRDAAQVRAYMKSKKLTFPTVMCDAQLVKVLQQYGLSTLPTVYIIDRGGIVKDGMAGFPPEKVIAAKLR